MRIRFDYKKDVSFYLKTASDISIEGKGIWDVDEWDLSEEYNVSDLNFEDFIKDYFWMTLDIDPDCIKFNTLDMKDLEEFCNAYKEANGN